MNKLDKLIQNDLQWASNIERAVLHACIKAGIWKAFEKTQDSRKIGDATKIDPKIIRILIPILKKIEASQVLNQSLDERDQKLILRILTLFKGGIPFLKGTAESYSSMWKKGEIDLESAKSFSRSMYDKSLLPAELHCANKPFASAQHLVDLGGGGGAWAQKALESQPALQFSIFDLKNVCDATAEILRKEAPSIAPKVQYSAGNFFVDNLPKGDAFLLSHILHDWTPDTGEALLKQLRSRMQKGSKLFIHECLLEEDKQSPRFTCAFHFLMMLNHASQQYTTTELHYLLTRGGFSKFHVVSKVAHYSLIECEA